MSRTLRVRGAELAYEVHEGDGIPLVWGHGLTSSRAAENDGLYVHLDEVAGAAPVIRYDARGHGESSAPADPLGYRWSELAHDQLALVSALGVDRYIAGGASMGAGTALHAAVIAPDRIVGLVLIIPPTAWETRTEQAELYEKMAAVAERAGVEPLIRAAELLDPADPLLGRPEVEGRTATRLRAAGSERLAKVFRGAATADLPSPEAVAGIGVPALVLAWTGDPGHPVATADRLAELLPDVEVGVASTWEELRGWTGRIVDFVERVGARVP